MKNGLIYLKFQIYQIIFTLILQKTLKFSFILKIEHIHIVK